MRQATKVSLSRNLMKISGRGLPGLPVGPAFFSSFWQEKKRIAWMNGHPAMLMFDGRF